MFGPEREVSPWAYNIYTDATWGTEDDRVSFQGVASKRYRALYFWLAQRQKSTALSSMEAEIMAASEGGKESAWMRTLTKDLGERETIPTFVLTLILLILFYNN